MTVGSVAVDGAGAASMRRNTSGAPDGDPAGSSGRAAGIMGMAGRCAKSAGRETGAAGESGHVVPIAVTAGAVPTSIGAMLVAGDTRLDTGATLAVVWLAGEAVELAASTCRLITPAGAREIDDTVTTGAVAAADSLEAGPERACRRAANAGASLNELAAAAREIVLPTANTPDCARDISRSVTAADSAPAGVARRTMDTAGELALAIGVPIAATMLVEPTDSGRPSALASPRAGEWRHTIALPLASPDDIAR